MKKLLIPLLCILFFGIMNVMVAQDANWRVLIEQLAEEGEMNQAAVDIMYEELLQLESNPMNLNRVTREQLDRFPLLSRDEIEAINTFLEKNRPLYTVFELRNVPRLDLQTVERILPFFYAGSTAQREDIVKVSEMVQRGQHEVQFRMDKTLTPRAGYGVFSDSILARYPNRKYSGEDFYHSLRYSFHYRDKLEMGFTAEKDAGEPFLKKGYAKGYDHYGMHLIVRDIGILKTAALGDYRLSFGQGLILNNNFMVSKAWSADNIARRTQQPKRHFSTAESGFFRGAAALIDIGNFSITTFYSNRNIDANLSDNGHITSFKTDGLHRTPSQMEKKKNTRKQVLGGNINYRKDRIQVGFSGLYHQYNRIYEPTQHGYNLYYLRDSANLNASIDYSWQLTGLIIAGETAISKNGAVATINMAQYRPSSGLSFTLLYRNYPISYNALHAEAFSEGSGIRNERGLFLGALFSPFARFRVNSYIDFIRYPWLKFGVDKPSKALDYYFLGTYSFTRNSIMDIRFKYKRKEKNMHYPDEQSTSVLPYATYKYRLRFSHTMPGGWNFRTVADIAHYKEKPFSAEKGYMLSQNIGYRGKKSITGDAYLAFFNAGSYNARLYSYERNLLNSFYMPSFYGKGMRLALSARYDIDPALSLSFKMGYTHYFNRDTIGSGTEQIDGKSRTDLYLYLKWRF